MVTSINFEARHYPLLPESAKPFGSFYNSGSIEFLESQPHNRSRTFINEEGKVVAFAGVIEIWPGRGEAWAMIDQNIGKDFVAFHRLAKAEMEAFGFKRIEATVSADFLNAHRWVKFLGFEKVSQRLKYFYPDGGDAFLYSRVFKDVKVKTDEGAA